MTNLNEDLSKLTTIPEKALNRLSDLTMKIIADAVYDSTLANEKTSEIDLGYGKLMITHEDHQLRFKFLPNTVFQTALINAAQGKLNSLEVKLEDTLVERILNTYKDLV